MTCTHQWHDATTKKGPEWICAHCKVTYTETKKAPPETKRTWVGLTDEDIKAVNAQVSQIPPIDYTTTTYAKAIEAKLKEKNT